MSIATLSIDLEARLARMEEGLDKAVRLNTQAAQRVDAAWGVAGRNISALITGVTAAFSVSVISQWARANLQAVDSLNDISDATGATVESISALQDLARRTGTEIDVVDTALVKLNQALNSAKPDSDQAKALQAIGLSANELRRLDPAEALRQVAVALGQYENDGNKARIVQELLGRSARELAPLLKDLGEAGKLTATVTGQQAAEAEKLVKQLGALNAEWARMSQVVVSSVAPALTQALRLLRSFRDGPGLGAALTEAFKGNQFGSAQEALTKYRADQGAAQRRVDDIKAGRSPASTIYGADLLKEAEQERDRLRALADTYYRVVTADGAGRGTDFQGRAGKATLAGLQEAEKKPRGLRTSKAEEDLAKRIAMLQAAYGDRNGAQVAFGDFRRGELAATDEVNKGLFESQIRAADQAEQAMAALLAQTRQGQVEAVLSQFRAVASDADAVGMTVKHAQALQMLGERFTELNTPAEQATKKMSEFAREAQRSIQQALGSTLKATLKGDFDSIAALWGNLLLDMATQALGARLNEKLFGQGAVGASMVDGLFSWLGLAQGGAFANGVQMFASGGVFGGPTMFAHAAGLGVLGEAGPEAVLPLKRGRGGSLGVVAQGGGPAVVIHQNLTLHGNASETQVRAIMQASKAETLRAIADANRRGGGNS